MSFFSRFTPVPIPTNRDSELYTGVLEQNFQALEQAINNIGKQFESYTSVYLTLEAGEALNIGELCCLNATGKMVKADADSTATATRLLGVANRNIASGSTGQFVIKGIVQTTGLVAGNIMYISKTAGEWTHTTPTGTGEVSRIIGYALDNNRLLFDPDKTWIEF